MIIDDSLLKAARQGILEGRALRKQRERRAEQLRAQSIKAGGSIRDGFRVIDFNHARALYGVDDLDLK